MSHPPSSLLLARSISSCNPTLILKLIKKFFFIWFTLAIFRFTSRSLWCPLKSQLLFLRDQQSTARAGTLPGEARPGIATLTWEAAFVGGLNCLQLAGKPKLRSRLYHSVLSCPSLYRPDQFLVLKFYSPTGNKVWGTKKDADRTYYPIHTSSTQ